MPSSASKCCAPSSAADYDQAAAAGRKAGRRRRKAASFVFLERRIELISVETPDPLSPDEPGGENLCRDCSGRGRSDGQECETCGGTGTVVEPVGGA